MANAWIDFLFSQSAWANRIENKIDKIGELMPTIAEALQAWTDYTTGLKQQLADAETALTAANDTIQQLKDTDAAEDAAEAAALQDQIAGQISDALTAVQNPPAPPPDATPPEDAGTVTPPTDTGGDTTPPADTSGGDTTPPADTSGGDTTPPADTSGGDASSQSPWQ